MKTPKQTGRIVRFGARVSPEEQARQDARQLLNRFLEDSDETQEDVLRALVLLLKPSWDTRQ